MLAVLATVWLAAAPADCAAVPENSASLPFEIDLGGKRAVPGGVNGKVFLDMPVSPRIACPDDNSKPPADVLRGEPGDLLKP